jgi:hypothetical protein
MYVYILVALILVFALWKERQALGCPDNILSTADCDNANGKAVKGTRSYPTDSTPVVVENIKKAADFGDRWVMWRIGLLLSFPCVVIIYFFLNSSVFSGSKQCFSPTGKADDLVCSLIKSFPSEKELVIGMFVITALVYFTLNFYKFHLINYAKKNIDEGADILASRIS